MKNLSPHFDFHLILLGINEWIETRKQNIYQIPELTQWSLHRIHARQVQRNETPTVTHHQTLLYLTQNIDEIFDAETELPPESPIEKLVDNFWDENKFEMGDGVYDYFKQSKIRNINTISALINFDENSAAEIEIDTLRDKYNLAGLSDEERQAIDRQYFEWRSFFTVEHNIVNPSNDGLLFNHQWDQIRDKFYQHAESVHERIVQTESDGNRYYLISPNCGLLYRNSSGRFEPLKWCPAFEGVESAKKRPVLEHDFVLKQTHQSRILIPGIPEIQLYKELQNHFKVKSVQLYPGVDRYDLRVELISGHIDAIDVKDHRRPGSIEKILRNKTPMPRIHAHETNLIGYDNFFYLVPEIQVQGKGYPRGLQDAKALANRHKNLYVNTIEGYMKGLDDV